LFFERSLKKIKRKKIEINASKIYSPVGKFAERAKVEGAQGACTVEMPLIHVDNASDLLVSFHFTKSHDHCYHVKSSANFADEIVTAQQTLSQ